MQNAGGRAAKLGLLPRQGEGRVAQQYHQAALAQCQHLRQVRHSFVIFLKKRTQIQHSTGSLLEYSFNISAKHSRF